MRTIREREKHAETKARGKSIKPKGENVPCMHYEINHSLAGELGELENVSKCYCTKYISSHQMNLGMTYYWLPEAPGPGVRGEKDGEVGE